MTSAGVVGGFGGNLGARLATTDDEHAFPAKLIGIAVLRAVQDLSGKRVGTGNVRHVGNLYQPRAHGNGIKDPRVRFAVLRGRPDLPAAFRAPGYVLDGRAELNVVHHAEGLGVARQIVEVLTRLHVAGSIGRHREVGETRDHA